MKFWVTKAGCVAEQLKRRAARSVRPIIINWKLLDYADARAVRPYNKGVNYGFCNSLTSLRGSLLPAV